MPIAERTAALYDVHGNLPALEATLAAVCAVGPDLIVVGGDVFPGPLGAECLARLAEVDIPLRCPGVTASARRSRRWMVRS